MGCFTHEVNFMGVLFIFLFISFYFLSYSWEKLEL